MEMTRRKLLAFGSGTFALATLSAAGPAASQDGAGAGGDSAPVTRAEYDRLLEQVAGLERALAGSAGGKTPSGEARLGGHKGGLYDKPFLDRFDSSVHLGGYFDVEYRDPEGGRHDFDFHRLIPFIYGNVGERVRFATEIEIEHGEEVAGRRAHFPVVGILDTGPNTWSATGMSRPGDLRVPRRGSGMFRGSVRQTRGPILITGRATSSHSSPRFPLLLPSQSGSRP